MRIMELMVGGLLVISGVASPFVGTTESIHDLPESVKGDFWLESAKYSGEALLRASDAGFRTEGPATAQLKGPKIVVSYHELSYVNLEFSTPVLSLDNYYSEEQERRVIEYEDASIQITGKKDGVLQGWPVHSPSRAVFELALEAPRGSQVIASPFTTWLGLYEDSRYEHLIEAPVYAVTHQGSELEHGTFDKMTIADAHFAHLNATGDLIMIVENSEIRIDHPGGTETISVWQDANPVGVPSTATVDVETLRFAAITLIDGEMSMDVESAQAAFLAKDPRMQINGTTTMDVQEGNVSADGKDKKLQGAEVHIAGNTTLNLTAEGETDGQGELQVGPLSIWNLHDPLTEQPEMRGDFETDSNDVRVAGQPLVVTPSAPGTSLPEQATLLAKVVGALLLVWGLARGLLPVFVGMVANKPLKNARRREIFEFLRSTGMAHLREIHRATQIPIGSLQYHLNILRQARLVSTVRRSGYLSYFVSTVEFCQDDIQRLALLSDPSRRKICQAITAHDNLTQHELAKQLGLTSSAVSKQLSTLVKAGLVDREGIRNAHYKGTDLLRRWLTRRPPSSPVNGNQHCTMAGTIGA